MNICKKPLNFIVFCIYVLLISFTSLSHRRHREEERAGALGAAAHCAGGGGARGAAHVAMLALLVSVLGWGLCGAAAAYDVTSWAALRHALLQVPRGALGLRQAVARVRHHALPRPAPPLTAVSTPWLAAPSARSRDGGTAEQGPPRTIHLDAIAAARRTAQARSTVARRDLLWN